jgi:hypothetical protein
MKNTFLIILILGILCPNVIFPQANQIVSKNFIDLNDSHDIQLPSWGPYSKKYAGTSHLPDVRSGMRFDFSVLPGFYRNKIIVPNVQFESGYFPWDVAADLSTYTYRYELEWKDKVFVDVTYSELDSLTMLVSMRCVNNTLLPQNLSLNLISSIDYPDVYPVNTLIYSKNSIWTNAVDYESVIFAKPRPKDNLVTDGWNRGEIRNEEFIDGSALAQDFGKEKGDRVIYHINLSDRHRTGALTILYRMKENTRCLLHLSGLANQGIILTGTGKLTQVVIPFQLTKEKKLTITSEGGDAIELNGALFTPYYEESLAKIIPVNKEFSPEIVASPDEKKIILKYRDVPNYYGIRWSGEEDFRLRQVKNDELDVFFKRLVHSHVETILKGNNKGNYTNIFIRPVVLEAKSENTINAVLCTGNLQEVEKKLKEFDSLKGTALIRQRISEKVLPEGEKFMFSQKMLRATLMTNIVYPIYIQRKYIRHFTPGKWWNSLYTWDSGFIALGLSEINVQKAVECLNAYTTPVGSQSAFIHHGSPVPVQIYAFQEIWNKTQSRGALHYFYPRLKQYYEFMSGRLGSSSTRALKSNLLKAWDYWNNSGGWDDYPAQVQVHRLKAERTVAPVINTAQQIRIAKILRMAAAALGKKEDLHIFDRDIKDFTAALQKYSWNESSGYFGYVTHDENGNAIGQLLDDVGNDYNMGLDGAYPLIAGICNAKQQSTLLEKIFSEKNMWTPSGISVVDQSAPYYKTDGYWNGSVWMPHQWFLWKTMLDIGRPDLAFKIADKGLNVYKNETDESYYTFEHFLTASGRGAGWHQFSGLSTPVLSWFSAYYRLGTMTAGFEIWIENQSFNDDCSYYRADIAFDNSSSPHRRCMVLCLNPNYKYQATFSGKELEVETPFNGLLNIYLPATNKAGEILVKRVRI